MGCVEFEIGEWEVGQLKGEFLFYFFNLNFP